MGVVYVYTALPRVTILVLLHNGLAERQCNWPFPPQSAEGEKQAVYIEGKVLSPNILVTVLTVQLCWKLHGWCKRIMRYWLSDKHCTYGQSGILARLWCRRTGNGCQDHGMTALRHDRAVMPASYRLSRGPMVGDSGNIRTGAKRLWGLWATLQPRDGIGWPLNEKLTKREQSTCSGRRPKGSGNAQRRKREVYVLLDM